MNLTHLGLVIVATLDCNRRCKYCYAKGGERKEKTKYKLARDFILYFIGKNPSLKSLTVSFFGGEPTLNFPLIKKVVHFCQKQTAPIDIGFRISTNGICSNVVWEYLIDNDFGFVVSMDGIPKINSLLRGSSRGLEEKIRRLVAAKKNFHIRATLTDLNIAHFPEAIRWWAKLGVPNVHFEIVTDQGRALESKIKPPSLSALSENIKKSVEIAEREGVYLTHSSWMNLLNPSDYFCTSCKGMQYILLPNGQISSCFMAENDDQAFRKFIVGEMLSGTVTFNKNLNYLKGITVNRMTPCKNCDIKQLCGGGCLAKHLAATGSILHSDLEYCSFKKLMVRIGREALEKNYKCVLGYDFLNQREGGEKNG